MVAAVYYTPVFFNQGSTEPNSCVSGIQGLRQTAAGQ